MIGYSDSSFASSLCAPATPPKANSPLVDQQHRLPAGNDKRGAPIQLTPLWEHVVRTQSVPKDVNLADIFVALNDRLRDPEWEVRQHALRVLVDVIPVMDDTLDQRMEILLGDLVGNLGHPGPAVRKGALDSLKVYLTHSMHADDILHNIVFRGIENYTDSQLQSDVVVGIILSLPNLIFPGSTSDSTVDYVVRSLIAKLVQVTFQEVSLRSLTRIRDMIGHAEFDRILEDTQPNTRRDFELLCEVYNSQNQKPGFVNHDNSFADENRPNWNDLNANIIQDNRWNSDSDSAGIISQDELTKSKEMDRNESVDTENNVPSGKVILETEIQFNSSTAVTMKILEEGESKSVNDSDSDEDNRDCVVKVLSDSENEDAFELRRRTPRRVRFGGEIVKLRTPDSDSNQPSDTDNDITITTTPTGDSNNPVIEIKFITNDRKDGKRSHQSRSLIPVPVTPVTQKPKARSLPTSPSRKMEIRTKSKLLYQSHPNLTRAHFFVDKQNKNQKQKSSRPEKLKIDGAKKQTNYVDNATSPMLVHREIELFHNLSRSPTRSPEFPEEFPTEPPVKEYVEKGINDRKLSTADSILLEPKQKIREERSITTADSSRQKRYIPDGIKRSSSSYKMDPSVTTNGETLRSIVTADRQKKILPEVPKLSASAGAKKVLPDIPKMSLAWFKKEHSVISTVDTFTTDMSDSESNPGRTFSSFILKDSGSDGIQSDCYIPTIDNGECLTCSSSGSEGVQTENSWESVGVLDKRIIEDIHDKDDWRVRLRGFESFAEELRSPQLSQELTPYMSSLLHFLFSAERHPRLQSAVENVLKLILSNASPECLKTNLSQIAVSLSKMGAPAGIRLSIIVMQKLSAKALVQHLLEDPIMSSRSAKSREGAMQILLCATTMFPSTEFDTVSIANRVALVATDRKRRIRQSTLDVLAVLGQIGSPGEILEAVALASKDLPDRDGLIAAVRARLARRQFPIVEVDGSVVYASPGVGHGADVEWVAAGSGSISPCSARSRRRAMELPSVGADTTTERAGSAIVSQRNMWSARRFKDPAEPFGKTVQHPENVTWALVPVKDKEETQTKPYPATQLWAIEQPNINGDIRLNGNSGSLRPVYLLQAQQQPPVRLRQVVPNDSSADRTSSEKQHFEYARGRSSSPPVRLVQIKGATRASRGQSSSPPEYGGRPEPDTTMRRRMFPLPVSSGSSQSRGSPPRNNWQREFQSAIPVPVGAEGRSRFRKRYRDSPPSQPPQPMVALGHHGQGVGSAPVRAYERTKSPSPTRFNADKFNISQDSGINQQTSSGSESSDYYTPPAEPYLPLQPTEPAPANQNVHEDSFDQSDRSETPPAQQRERFINLEDSPSGSDFEDQETKKNSEDSQDDQDFVRTQVFQKLQEEHIARVAAEETAFRERVTESRLSKSHADLSEVKKLNRKSISSAPLVKHMKGTENHFFENKLNNNTVDEESKSSRNSSTLELISINQSQTELRSLNQSQLDVRSLNQSQLDVRSLNQSQLDVRSLNQSQGDLRSSNTSHSDLRSINQSQVDIRSLNQSQGDLYSLNESQTDLYSLNQSQGDLPNGNKNQKDLRSLNQSQGDIRNLNQSQADLRNQNYQQHEIKSEVVKCPDIVKKTPKSTPKSKVELKRRSSNIPSKIPPIFPDSLRKFPKPREGMSEMISQLESPEWEMTMKGLQSLVRLIRHHPEMIEAQMHTVCVLLGRHIKNLRSQVARASCLAAAEMFTTHRKPLEMELEEIACPLLHRTADTNKFLRADANEALDAMCINMNTSRVMSVLSTRGATHHNAVVRCTAVRLVTELVHRLGSQKVFQLPKDTRDRMLQVGANMLTEGSLETRKHAKHMFTELSGHSQFQRAMLEAVPASTMRHISKIIKSLK